jgi:hypothetical protein
MLCASGLVGLTVRHLSPDAGLSLNTASQSKPLKWATLANASRSLTSVFSIFV